MSDPDIEPMDASEIDLAHDDDVGEEPQPLGEAEMLELDEGPEGGG